MKTTKYCLVMMSWFHEHKSTRVIYFEAKTEEEAELKMHREVNRINDSFNVTHGELLECHDDGAVLFKPRKLTLWERLMGRIKS